MQPTSAAKWRQQAQVTLELPSGMVATLRTPSLNVAVRLGYLPDSLTPLVAQMISGNHNRVEVDLHNMQDLTRYIELMDALVASAFVAPVVVIDRAPNPDANEISISDLTDADIAFVSTFINAPAGALARFRDQQTRAMESMDSKSGDQQSAERDIEAGTVGS